MQVINDVKNIVGFPGQSIGQQFHHQLPRLWICGKSKSGHFLFQFRPFPEVPAKAPPEIRQGGRDDGLPQDQSVRFLLLAIVYPPADGSGFSVSNRGHDGSDRIFGNVGQLIGQRTGDIRCIQLDRHCEAPRSLYIPYHHTGRCLELQEIENHTQESGKQCKAGPTLRKPQKGPVCKVCGNQIEEIDNEVHRTLKMALPKFWIREDVYFTVTRRNV